MGYLQSPSPNQKTLRYDNGRIGAVPRQAGPAPIIVFHMTDVEDGGDTPSPYDDINMELMARKHPWGPHSWYSPYDRELLQFIPVERTSYALEGNSTFETNHCGHVYQVEISDRAADGAKFTDEHLRNIARDVLVPWHKATGGLLVGFRNGIGSQAYGYNSPSRMTPSNWVNRSGGDHGQWGVCLHQNVPGQTHWDAPIRIHDLVWFALEILEEEKKASAPAKPIVLPPLPQEAPPVIHGNLDAVGSLTPGKVFVAGWVAETADPMQIDVTVGGKKVSVAADKPRGDVGVAFPELGSNHGYHLVVDAPGGFMVDVYVQAGSRNWHTTCYVLPEIAAPEAPEIDVEAIVDQVVSEAVADIQDRLAA